jgi:hypothetical protein
MARLQISEFDGLYIALQGREIDRMSLQSFRAYWQHPVLRCLNSPTISG